MIDVGEGYRLVLPTEAPTKGDQIQSCWYPPPSGEPRFEGGWISWTQSILATPALANKDDPWSHGSTRIMRRKVIK